jgi:AcrR family transcriptional regulator
VVISETRTSTTDRREGLLRVAREIFAERGYQATTMDDVAAAAGFTKPILYQHFASKEALYNEIVAATAAQLLEGITASTAGVDSPREKVEAAFRAFFEIVVNETSAFRILFLQPQVGNRVSELRRVESRLASFIEEQLTAPSDPSHRRQVAASVIGMAEGAATSWLVQQEALGWPPVGRNEIDSLAQRTATLAWGGLRTINES